MKQTIHLKRVETRTLILDVPQPLTRQTLTDLANQSLSGVGHPAFGATTAHQLTDWSIVHLEPKCECEAKGKKGKKHG